jgi:hypothetical protein
MNLLYLSSHAILEYDQTKLWTDLGYDVFSIGAYTNPQEPAVALRQAVPRATYYRDLAELCHAQRIKHDGQDIGYPIIDWAKADLHPDVVDWAETVIVDCYPESWIPLNWPKFTGKRVIWRTIGQSSPGNEELLATYRPRGLEIVRYSPNERVMPGFAGEDALIRFAKDPADWYGWTGARAVIGNLAQHDGTPHARDPFLHWDWITQATAGLPFEYGGPNSEKTGGIGALDYEAMRVWLRGIRAYVYSGTMPASYTLALIEAMMTGVPVVSIGKAAFGFGDLFEADEIAGESANDALMTRLDLEQLLRSEQIASLWSSRARQRAIDLFGVETIGKQWLDYLGAPVPKPEMVAA